ncbi:MAG: efflux RND transporter permease subunit [Lachnospiraceae bacterium]|nr:efflux RND transporter permease subunit [Lachnospiraceae bacterium]
MNGIVKGALNRPITVIVAIMGLVLFAIVSISSITLKLMPDMSIPYMVVNVVYSGASPEEVDDLIIDPVSDAVKSISGMKSTQGVSNENYGYVLMEFEYGTDMDDAYNDVKEAVDGIKSSLPSDAGDPSIMEIDMDASDDITLSITSDYPDVDVLSIVNNDLEPMFKNASALSDITVTGGDEKYIRVRLSPEKVSQYGLTVTSVANAISAVNFSMPAGSADYGDQVLNLTTEVKYEKLDELEQVPITTTNGDVIHLADVADVSYGISDKTSLSRYDGKDNVSVGLKKKQSSTSVDLSNQIKKIVAKIEQQYPNLKVNIVNDASDTIIESLMSVATSIVEAVFLAMFVLFLFFGDLKGALIVGSSMPISLLATIILMNFMGLSLNVVTMNALVLGIGMMTDNAVVVIEMCFRKRDEGMGFKEAAYEGTSIVMGSVIGSTITSVVVYLPLAVMDGLSGQMFKQLGFTIIFTLMSSLIAAITLVPVFFNMYKPVEKKKSIVNTFLAWLSKKYGFLLRHFLKWKKTVLLLSIVLLFAIFAMAGNLKSELMSSTDEGTVSVSVTFRNNLNIDEMNQVMAKLEDFVSSSEYIEHYTTTVNQSGSTGSIAAYEYDDIDVTTQDIVDDWNQKLSDFSDIAEIKAGSASTMGSSMSSSDSVEFIVESYDMDALQEAAGEIQNIMRGTNGVLRAESSIAEGGSQIKIDINPVMAQQKGFSAQTLAGLVYKNMSGTTAIEDVRIDDTTYDVDVEFPKDYYKSLTDVRAMTFVNPSGVSIPLSEMADIRLESAPTTVTRKNGKYVATLTATTTSSSLDNVTTVLHSKIDNMTLPEGVDFGTNSTDEMMSEEFASIGMAIVIAFFLVFAVMAIQFESIIDSVLIMFTIPFAMIGSIVLMLIMRAKISMSSLMGILMLAGIVVNNGIILIDMAIQNQKSGMNTYDALVDAGTGRLRPILITTLTTELAMMPVAFGFAKNSENMAGMAIVMVGGLVASTILSLLFLPTFYLIIDSVRARFERFNQRRKDKKIEKRDLKSKLKQMKKSNENSKK